MRALAITHQRDAGPGVFAETIAANGVALEEWRIAEIDAPPADPLGYDAVISLGGAMHADQDEIHPWLRREKGLLGALLERGIPLLGVCLGAQLLSEAAGGSPRRAAQPEIGWYEVAVTEEGAEDPLVGPMAPGFEAFEWHSYECGLPPTATILARTPTCAQAYRLGESAWGIQFHAEVSAADLQHWITEYHVDPDAVAIGLDPDTLRAQTAPRIERWNELGHELCDRFLGAAINASLGSATEV